MGVLAASKPWPMSPPLNPSDFPGSNPHAVHATVITNYLRANPEGDRVPSATTMTMRTTEGTGMERNKLESGNSSSPGCVRNREYLTVASASSPGRFIPTSQTFPSPTHNYRMSMGSNVTPPLYEIVRPKSAYFDEIEQLTAKMKACRKLESEFQSEISHQRQRSEQQHARPTVPPPLPPNRPSSVNGIIATRADAHLLQPPTTPTCVPWLKKIKMVKKLKRKIGIGGNKSGTSFNNLPALNFNSVHGENIQIFQSGTVATRINSFCKAIAFTDRPVKVNEKVCVRLIEISTNWSGVLRFGFTNQDPSTLRNSLPKYVCPDLTSRPGFWAKAFSDHLVKKDAILNFHVNSAGEVHFGIDGDDKGVFLSGVDTRSPLWAVFDIYGNTTSVELVDCRAHLNNSRPSLSESPACSTRHQHQSPSQHQHQHQDSPSPSTSVSASCQSSYSPLKSKAMHASRSQIHLQPSPAHRIPHFISARSLPDSQLYSTTASYAGYGQPQIPTMQASYLPVPLPVKSTSDFPALNRTINGPIANPNPNPCPRPQSSHISTNASSCLNQSQSSSSVYKTPPTPKLVRDDYESLYLVKQSMSVKPGPGPCSTGLTNYVSIPSLVKMRSEAVTYSSEKVETGVSSGSPSKDQPAMSLECLACCERPVDSVFYSCGHMCMCFQCAVDYWRTKEKGHCPICRAAINDVIRTYT